MAFNMFPYSNLHRMNTDWVLEEIRKAQEAVEEASEEVQAAAAIMEGYDEHLSTLDQSVSDQGDRINSINTGLTDLAGHAVQTYDQTETFTDEEKSQARTNIGAVALTTYNSNKQRVDAILEYQGNQISALELSDTTQAGQISALELSDTTQAGQITALQAGVADTVKYTTQSLTNAQKLQARQNIGAAADSGSGGQLVAVLVSEGGGSYHLEGMTSTEILKALVEDYIPVSVIFPTTSNDIVVFNDLRAIKTDATNYVILATSITKGNSWELSIVSSGSTVSYTVKHGVYNQQQIVKDLSSTAPSLTPEANTTYEYRTLTSLTITSPPADGAWSVVFTSGSTATVTTIPATILGLESFSAEANTLYEINVLDNRAVVGSWAVSA